MILTWIRLCRYELKCLLTTIWWPSRSLMELGPTKFRGSLRIALLTPAGQKKSRSMHVRTQSSYRWKDCKLFSAKELQHYNDVIMGTIASQITSLTIVYSTVYSDADQKNIKGPRHWPLCGEFTGTGEFPVQMASNAENVSIWWRHHE